MNRTRIARASAPLLALWALWTLCLAATPFHAETPRDVSAWKNAVPEQPSAVLVQGAK